MPLVRFLAPTLSGLLFITLGACGNDTRAPADIPPKELVQSGCERDEDCPGSRCVVGIGEGLCTADCSVQADCPDGTVCTDTEATAGVCLLTCEGGAECTEHLGSAYTCDTESNLETGEDVRVCIDGR